MSPNFDRAVALTSEDARESNDMRWSGHMTKDWSIGPVPNGGYTSALQLHALLSHTGYPVASSLTTHYYRPTIGGEDCTIHTQIQRAGRTTTHADATLTQDGKIRARTVAVLGDYPADDVVLPTQPPRIAPPDACEARDPKSQGLNMSLMDSLEIRLDTTVDNIDAEGGAVIDAWVRFRDERPNDALAMALFVDSFPPAVLMAVTNAGWVPTIEMTTHIRAAAADGWIQGRVTTANVRGGTLVEDVQLWDSSGTLVAEARQLALLRTQ